MLRSSQLFLFFPTPKNPDFKIVFNACVVMSKKYILTDSNKILKNVLCITDLVANYKKLYRSVFPKGLVFFELRSE